MQFHTYEEWGSCQRTTSFSHTQQWLAAPVMWKSLGFQQTWPPGNNESIFLLCFPYGNIIEMYIFTPDSLFNNGKTCRLSCNACRDVAPLPGGAKSLPLSATVGAWSSYWLGSFSVGAWLLSWLRDRSQVRNSHLGAVRTVNQKFALLEEWNAFANIGVGKDESIHQQCKRYRDKFHRRYSPTSELYCICEWVCCWEHAKSQNTCGKHDLQCVFASHRSGVYIACFIHEDTRRMSERVLPRLFECQNCYYVWRNTRVHAVLVKMVMY